jgi:integrase
MWALQLRCSERPAQESRNHSGLRPFVLYTLRRMALTKLGERAGGDAFVLARIAGHSSITVTQRYIHPQPDAINRVFAASQPQVVTKLSTLKNAEIGAKEKPQRDTA